MKYMPPAIFADAYDVPLDTVMMFLRQHKEYRHEIIDPATRGKVIFINYEKWRQENDKIDDIINYCQWIYYPLLEIYGNDYKIAKRLNLYINRGIANWNNFLRQRLFRVRDSFLSLGLGKMFIEFGYWGTRLLLVGMRQLKREGKWEEILKRLE